MHSKHTKGQILSLAGKPTRNAERDKWEVNGLSVRKKEMDPNSNLRVIEWLKAELVDTMAQLLKSLLRTGSDATVDALATLIILAYVLGRRLGISFQIIEMRIKHKLNHTINEATETDRKDGDLFLLQNYLEGKENKKR